MKKLLLGIVILAALGFGVYKLAFSSKKEPGGAPAPKDKPLTISKNSAAFNESFEKLLNSYFSLRQGLTDYDTAKANAAARQLALYSDGLKTDEIKGDSTGAIRETAKMNAGTISSSARQLAAEADLVRKKHGFQTISDALYDLSRMVQYDRMKLFHQHCPMAFNDTDEATWLSNSPEVVNPYLGSKHPKYKDKMLHCGDVTDSLDFTTH
jgi:Cu(I)/Ag(I) efflux system membrane fusion protein